MAITNGYTTLAEMKAELGIGDASDDALLEASVNAASRQIDRYCGRRFWQDAQVVVREYHAEHAGSVLTDDISTTTGLLVAADTVGDATFTSTLTISTDFFLEPTNAADEYPVRPYTAIAIAPTGGYAFPRGRRPGVRVTAKFGWPAIPDDIHKAAMIQAGQLFKAKDAVFGVAGVGDLGVLRVRSSLNPIAEGLIDPYAKPAMG